MTDCTCKPTGDLTWCERHHCWKTPHWIELCQTRPAYTAAWDAGRGPGQAKTNTPTTMPVWLTCPHRGQQGREVMAKEFGCGCGTIQFHECRHFGEPIVLKVRNEARLAMIEKIDGYMGRTCATCPIPGDLPVQQSSVSPRQPVAEPVHTAPDSVVAASQSTRWQQAGQ